jgi:VWFA-related protein
MVQTVRPEYTGIVLEPCPMAKRTLSTGLLRPVLVLAVCLLVLASASSEQQPATSQPTFRSGTELVRLPVTVVDREGRPVRDLKPSDFSVKIDGRDRELLFANLVGPAGEGAASAAGSVPLPSYAINTASGRGRAVVFVVDLISIKQGYEKAILDTAAALVDALGDSDAVGAMAIPGKGVDLTRDRQRVSAALRLLRGTTNVPFITHYFTVREAVAFEQLNRRVMTETIERECCFSCTTCPSELRDETREFLRYARYHVQSVLTSLTGLAAALKPVEAPKTIVLLSAGLPFEQESMALFTEVQRALTRAGIMIYAVQVTQPDADAGSMRRPGVGTYQSSDITTGLANVATMSGGAMFMGVGTASGIFERLRAEIVQSYELGVEAIPADTEGKVQDVRVTVNRPGVTVRSQRSLVPPDDIVDPATKLRRLLAQPVDVADLPVAATAYTVRGEEPATLKVIIAAELALGLKLSSPLSYALTVMQDGKVAFETDGKAPEGVDGTRVVTAAQLAPGRYRLRVAAIDAAGRGGTVEVPLAVSLRDAAGLQFSDVIVGAIGESFTPAIRARAGDALGALIELYSAEPARFASATVAFELRKANEAAVLARGDGILAPTSLERRQVAEGRLMTAGLPPGDYLVSAIVSLQGTPVSRVGRRLVLEP